MLTRGDEKVNSAPEGFLERATSWIIAVAACVMLGVGIGLAFTDRTASAGAAWGVGFLLVALLLISKFKRFKGFGFEAEMWEQKQEEAAALVDQLKSLATVISKQMAVIAARVGQWGSALSMTELADLIEDLQEQLKGMDIPSHKVEEASCLPSFRLRDAQRKRIGRPVLGFRKDSKLRARRSNDVGRLKGIAARAEIVIRLHVIQRWG